MGRSQHLVFGYGIILTAQQFLQAFPNTLRYDQRVNGYQEDESQMRQLRRSTDVLRFAFSTEQDDLYSVTHVFITTRSAKTYTFEKGYTDRIFESVDPNQINTEAQSIDSWLRQNFPNAQRGYYLFGYATP